MGSIGALGQRQEQSTKSFGFSNGYKDVANMPGLVVPGNIDMTKRQMLINPASGGDYGSEYSGSFNDGKNEVLVPSIYTDPNGNVSSHSKQQAIERYQQTGEHMGKFATGDYTRIDAYAQKLHERNIFVAGKNLANMTSKNRAALLGQ